MSVNKNFVVKNGFEVSTDLILADASSRRVGISSTSPRYTLDVRGGIGATDIYATGNTYTVGISTIITELNVGTNGSVFTALGVGGSVGIGTALPEYLLDVRSPSTTGQTALYVQGDVQITGDLNVDDITFDDALVSNLEVTEALLVSSAGISTFTGYVDVNNSLDISTDLNVVGLTTLGGYVDINADADFSGALNVGGATTIGGYVDINSDADINGTLNVSGIATFGTLLITSGIVTATSPSGIVTYYGDGSELQGVIGGIGIGTTGGTLGYGVTFVNFFGTGVSTAFYESSVGIATIFFEGGGGGGGSISISTVAPTSPGSGDLWYSPDYGRTFIYYDETIVGYGTDAYWVDAAPFNSGIDATLVGVAFSSGSAISPSLYFAGDVQTGFFSPAPGQFTIVSTGSSVLNVNADGINVTGVVTATSFVGDSINVTGVVTATSFVGDGSGLTGAGSTVYNDTTTNQEYYPLFTDITSGTITASGISTSKLTYNPSSGEMTAINFNSTSDKNLKTNIKTVENSLEIIEKLRGVSFDWKETGSHSYGVIAQELEEVLPELVKNGEVKSVNYNGLIGVLIESIKELKREILILKSNK